jgi:transposase-like protein
MPAFRYKKTSVKHVSVELKLQIIQDISEGRHSYKSISTKTGIPEVNLRQYVSKANRGQRICAKGGGQRLLSPEEISVAAAEVGAAAEQSRGITVEGANEFWGKKVEESFGRQGLAFDGTISESTIRRYQKEAGLGTVKAELKTKARLEAEYDIRNAVSNIVMWRCMLEKVKSLKSIINYDSTQYVTTGTPDNVRILIPKEEGIRGERSKGYYDEETNKTLGIGIKYMCIINAFGDLNPRHIFLVAHKEMEKDAFEVYECDGLGKDSNSKGYLCFAKTRAGNKAFFEWFTRVALMGEIKRLRSNRTVDIDSPFMVTCDGEKNQLDAHFLEAVMDEYSALSVMICKLAASTTAVSQACDAGNLFKGSKSMLRNLLKREFEDADLERSIKAILKMHLEKIKKDMTYHDRSRIPSALMACRHVINTVATTQTIRGSFRTIGVTDKCTVDEQRILKQYSVHLTLNQMMDLQHEMANLCKIFNKQGFLKDSDMDAIDAVFFSEDIGSKPRDERVLCQQRCVWLNKVAVSVLEKKAEDALNAENKKRKAPAARGRPPKQSKTAIAGPMGTNMAGSKS